jgi:hypothetical protein
MDFVNVLQPMGASLFVPVGTRNKGPIYDLNELMSEAIQPELEEKANVPVFIEANTLEVSISDLLTKCTIPVFAKDNEATISHNDFISSVEQVVGGYYPDTRTQIRVSHPIKGRIPEARHKKASDLLPHEETLYYERMMFVIEVPSVRKDIGGNSLSLTIGGVRSYHLDNLHSKKSAERFKLFIGFKNKVCSNMCVWSDGFVEDCKAFTHHEIQYRVQELIERFNPKTHLEEFASWQNKSVTEKQFAEFIGRCRMYLYMPKNEKQGLPKLEFGDGQLNQVVDGYYNDENFSRHSDGSISVWNLYNLFTGANKSSYIDRFLERSVNALDVVRNLAIAL